ncbi:hypothetical protein B0H34DRAFT_213982 [Crassisporium funariophilum]|nr:hypothetical protein B0H34DRAFT_213982 [Crassisporium funariophilum]
MNHNVGGNKKRSADNTRPRSYPSQQQAQPISPLLSRIRNFNNLALNSIGTFFSGPNSAKNQAHLEQDEGEYARNGLGIRVARRGSNSGSDWDSISNKADDGVFDGKILYKAYLPEDEDLTPMAEDYCMVNVDGYCDVKQRGYLRNLRRGADSALETLQANARSKNILDAPVTTGSGPYEAHTSSRFPEVRRLFGGLTRSQQSGNRQGNVSFSPTRNLVRNMENKSRTSNESDQQWRALSTSSPMVAAPLHVSTPLSASATAFTPSSIVARTAHFRGPCLSNSSTGTDGLASSTGFRSLDLETPPLTPDSLTHDTSFPRALNSRPPEPVARGYDTYVPRYSGPVVYGLKGYIEDPEEFGGTLLYTSSKLLEVKEGKKPERAIDIHKGSDTTLPDHDEMIAAPSLQGGQNEWYGLEYTLELSSRERQPSVTQSPTPTIGEHSKSRESWAAIHRGSVHPYFEDEDYHQWKNWHRFLDRQDERRKHRKGFAFKSHSKDMAWFFADEIRTWDVMYWQKEAYGLVAREVKERLSYIAEYRPDPFIPPRKHDLGWYLKRSRSIGCLREMQPTLDIEF